MNRVVRLLVAIVSLPCATCSDDPAGSTGDFAMAHAWIEGTVLDAQQEPPPGVSATIAVYAAGCEGGAITRTSSFLLGFDGAYRIRVVVFAASPAGFTGCVQVNVHSPASPASPIGSGQLDGVLFAPAEEPAPLVEINVRLP
jgi:hypothetical protein